MAITENRRILLSGKSELEFQAEVIQLAEAYGWMVFHAYDSRKSTGAGFPDLVMVRADPASADWRILFVELKKQGGRLSVFQHAWLNALRRVAGVCGKHVMATVWTPESLVAGEIDNVLRMKERE